MILDDLIAAAKKSGLTSYRLAKMTDLSAPGIRYVLGRKKPPSLDTVERIAEALGYELRLVRRKKS